MIQVRHTGCMAFSLMLLAVAQGQAGAQQPSATLIPDPAWDCYLPAGIPAPEAGELILEIDILLDRAVEIGTTQYGHRRVAVGLGGAFEGPKLVGRVMEGALDFEAPGESDHAWLNDGLWLSSNPGPGQGGVALTFYESTD